ncbi:RHS repeat domain-containing protein [Flavobacterium columnare]|uniref:RHS repeat-associated core domain-containing protein n=1 Tax=Flavobacterium columnare TaxID=996 RepID=A0AAJ4DDC0_9FLAO|nr:RHS repeat-associated core domain-containing protein [Flavobacterium columnare]AUX19144.1 hypothetical protein AQ623_13275 [Flavobacterium columnare]QCV57206.1 RHS repeat-associated core domain-containing protein [Flavobacterium columnare]QOG58219.1 RHS repeat-associated core domain-containing protein [Flavobacterium columnare]QOG60942.1 RHS repeat-associated core domain-containing protein [Flavobacterium columnare]QOG63662.1 RHS repeat-associated core domain-containing protein [Flavobacter
MRALFTHSDHLGSTSYISTLNGQLSQHVEYIAFGEVLFEEHSSSFSMPYLFNGKELDRETNLTYYGARYLDMKTSLWLNIDPLAEKFPNTSPYVYCLNNPIKLIDPDGKAPTDWYRNKITGKITWKDGQKERWGYERLGHTRGYTDKNGNRALLDGDTKQISYNGKVLADFSQNPKAEYGGFAIADGGNNQNPSELDRGGRNTQWIDLKGLIGLIDLLLGREPGKMGQAHQKGKGTNGTGNVDSKTSEAIDAVGASTGATNEGKNAIDQASKKEKNPSSSNEVEFVRTAHDEKTGNSTYVRKDIYDKQQKQN